MSTNYYWQPDHCKHCGRSDERIHICKSMTSWASKMEWDELVYAHVPTITSVFAWAQWLRAHNDAGYIVDEYGQEYEVEHFIEMAERVPMEARRRQYDWCASHPSYAEVSDTPGERKTWLDPEGFSFYGGEFC
jgi:hypothetical protein